MGETEVGLQQQATEPALLEAKSASKTIQMHSKVKKLEFWNLELLLKNVAACKKLAQLIDSSEGLRESLWPIETATYK